MWKYSTPSVVTAYPCKYYWSNSSPCSLTQEITTISSLPYSLFVLWCKAEHITYCSSATRLYRYWVHLIASLLWWPLQNGPIKIKFTKLCLATCNCDIDIDTTIFIYKMINKIWTKIWKNVVSVSFLFVEMYEHFPCLPAWHHRKSTIHCSIIIGMSFHHVSSWYVACHMAKPVGRKFITWYECLINVCSVL